jgi:hypothetical protein
MTIEVRQADALPDAATVSPRAHVDGVVATMDMHDRVHAPAAALLLGGMNGYSKTIRRFEEWKWIE